MRLDMINDLWLEVGFMVWVVLFGFLVVILYL